ncbi:hypothetical protein [Actinoplanes sp. NPDC049599]|uniref:hypothetical protein n=1 Tax=Actinoplanes sp. NPDC049599 TaxID=3363903 RepID=UPI00378A8097
MQRARRLASTTVVAVLAVAGLSACQAEPDVAAYLGGDQKITEEQVQRVYDQARDELTAAREQVQQQDTTGASAAALPPVEMPFKQKDVLNALLTIDVLEQAAAAKGVQAAAEPTVEQIAQGSSYSPNWEYTKLYARTFQLRAALLPKVTPAPLTDADLRPVYDRLRAGGAGDATPYEQFKTQLSDQNKQALQQTIGLRNELAEIVEDDHVKLNPRYGDQQLVLLSAQAGNADVPLVEVSFAGAGSSKAPFVTDVS